MTEPATDLHDALAPRAFLHDDPESYLAGVDDALAESQGDEASSPDR